MLTGKTLKQFQSFLIKNELDYPHFRLDNDGDLIYRDEYWVNYPLSMQIGVYQLFFDSIGINIDIQPVYGTEQSYTKVDLYLVNIVSEDYQSVGDYSDKSKPEAWKKAIEEANRINNKENRIMKTFSWITEYAHNDNEQTMQEWLYEYCELDITLTDGTYAEGKDEQGDLWAIHASGNGDSFHHRIDFEKL